MEDKRLGVAPTLQEAPDASAGAAEYMYLLLPLWYLFLCLVLLFLYLESSRAILSLAPTSNVNFISLLLLQYTKTLPPPILSPHCLLETAYHSPPVTVTSHCSAGSSVLFRH